MMGCRFCPFCAGSLPPWPDVRAVDVNDVSKPTAVIFENDDRTPHRLVSGILREIFGYPGHHAIERMTEVHERGRAVVAVVDAADAELLSNKAIEIARAAGAPLVVRVVPSEQIDDALRAPPPLAPHLRTFVEHARAYCAFVEHPVAENWSRSAAQLLASLYAGALSLDAVDPGTLDVEALELPPAPTSISAAPPYWMVLEPLAMEQDAVIGVGDLKDDLLDVYRDIRKGLAALDADPATAQWYWRMMFDAHWGAHASDALRILHALAQRERG